MDQKPPTFLKNTFSFLEKDNIPAKVNTKPRQINEVQEEEI